MAAYWWWSLVVDLVLVVSALSVLVLQLVPFPSPQPRARTPSSPPPPRLLAAILTVPRPHGARYLERALATLADERAHAHGVVDVDVVVVNMRPAAHTLVEEMRERYGAEVDFRDVYPRPDPPANRTWVGLWSTLSARTVRINLDLLEFLAETERVCRRRGIPSVLLLEDDFVWCPLALPHLARALNAAAAATPTAPPLAVRVSYGNNGLVLRCDDLPAILRQAELSKTLGPLDSVLGEALTAVAWGDSGANATWPELASLAGRPYWTYRYNLLEHIGHLSARQAGVYGRNDADAGDPSGTEDDDNALHPPAHRLRGSRGRLCYPACYAAIQYVGLMPDENFSDACLASTLSPCTPCPAAATAALYARARRVTTDGGAPLCIGLPFSATLAKAEAGVRSGAC